MGCLPLGRGCLLLGGCGIPTCTGAYNPPPRGDRITDACKNITLATTSLRPVIKSNQKISIDLNCCIFLFSYRVYCLIGDGESAESSIWEALSFCSHYNLDNIVAIFDVNRLGQSEPTAFQHDMDVYQKRLEAFG